MPRATAKFGDTTIADADSWETVEGNVYVCITLLKHLIVIVPRAFWSTFRTMKYKDSLAHSLAMDMLHGFIVLCIPATKATG